GRSAATCRKIAERARGRIRAHRPRFEASTEARERLTQEFARACGSGDLEGLIALLAEDAALWSDGGGQVAAAPGPIYGPRNVARFLLGVLAKSPPGMTARIARINGGPAIVAEVDGQVHAVGSLDIVDGRVRGVHLVVNPEKLRAVRGLPDG